LESLWRHLDAPICALLGRIPLLQEPDAAAAAEADPWGSYAAERAAAAAAAAAGAGAGPASAAAEAAAAGAAPAPAPGGGDGSGGGDVKLFKEFELVVEPEPEEDEATPEVQRWVPPAHPYTRQRPCMRTHARTWLSCA
jgi:hypothetical protein